MSQRHLLLLLGACAALTAPRALTAQSDVIRGRVTTASTDNRPIENVTVSATSLNGNVTRSARTGRDGRFTIIFPGGEGDYFVTFIAIGYAPRRYEVKRTADQDILIADARLESNVVTLDTIAVTGQGIRARPLRADTIGDVSGTERRISTAGLTAEEMGNLAAMAASMPGVTLIPGVNGDPSGYSVLGLDADQNSTSLNGMNSSDTELPRDANVSTSLATSPYDVSQGGFSGGRLNIRTSPGTNYSTRNTSLLLNTPQLEWTDPIGRSLGQEYTNVNLSGVASGPVSFNKSFYNLSYQLGRRASDALTLLNTDPIGLQAEGIAADSVTRLLSVLEGASVPAMVDRFSGNRYTDQALLFGSFDVQPPNSASGQALNVTFSGNWSRSSPASSLTMSLPASGYNQSTWNGSLRTRHTTYFGFGILSETGLSVTGLRSSSSAYVDLPSGTLRLHSEFPDGASGVRGVTFGGTPTNNSRTSNTLQFTNQLSWFSGGNKHRIKLTTDLRRDGYGIDLANNQLGTFSFNSLADLEAGTAASYIRQLTPSHSTGSQLVGGLSLGDAYRPVRDVQIVYGVRLDGNKFIGRPELNPAVDSVYGTPNDVMPNRVYVSPRIGFSWTYGTAQQIGAFLGAARAPRAIIRGGIGLFRNSLDVQFPSQAIANTGLPSGVQQLICAGAATPIPDWGLYDADPASIPSRCADGGLGTVFDNSSPNVTLFARDYAAQKSVRANLQWEGALLGNRLRTVVNGTYSWNTNQPGFADLNFNPSVRFSLPDEAGRPVFVDPASIVPATGVIASRDGRVSNLFSRVTERRSELSSVSRQLTLSLSPLSLNSRFTWFLNYTLNSMSDEASGFASTTGNPFDLSAGRASGDWRHQIQAQIGGNLFNLIRLVWTQRFQSGVPYTPSVGSDVNGDGYFNDRAFVFDPAGTADTAIASGMQRLLGASSGRVRGCLERQLGQLVSRGSCVGPWTSTSALSISINPVMSRLPQRLNISFSINNPLGAADLLLHDDTRTRGWGQAAAPDARLLIVRGFDPATLRYNYEVNQRFGNTSQAVSAIRNPVTLTMAFRFDIGATRERQGLTQTLDRGRTKPGNKVPEPQLKAQYSSAGLINPLAAILRAADSLSLTGPQADSIATLNRWYMIRLDSIWTPVVKYYAALPDRYEGDEIYDRYRRAREASVDLLVRIAPGTKALLSPAQRRKLPPLVEAYLDLRYLAAIRSGTSGTPGGVFAPGAGVPNFPTIFGR